MEAPLSTVAPALLYDRNNPAFNAPGAYAAGAQQGGLYGIALAPDAATPPGAVVEFPYRMVANLGRVRYYMLDPAAATDPAQAAFMRAYMAEPGVVARFGPATYTLAVETHPGPGGTVRLVARQRPAGVSPDGRFYIGRSPDVDTVRRIDAVPPVFAQTVPTTLPTMTDRERREAAALARATPPPPPLQSYGGGDDTGRSEPPPGLPSVARPRDTGPTLSQLIDADRRIKEERREAWLNRFARPRRGRGRKTGGIRSEAAGVGGVRTTRDESAAEAPEGPEALAVYKEQRAAQLERSVEWVQGLQQRQAELAAEALEEARARASEEARSRAQVEAEALGGTIPATRLAAHIRHRRAEIAEAIVNQAAIDAIQRRAAAQAQADVAQAIREQVEREVAAGLFRTVPRGRRRVAVAAAAPAVAAAAAGPPEINVQAQPAPLPLPGAPTTARRPSATRNRRHSNATVRAAAMSVFQDTVAQRLAHLPDDSPAIRDIIAEWSAATRSNPAGLTAAMARERAVQWWASQRWADVQPAERARYAEEAKARADSDAVVMAEAAVRQHLEETAAAAGAPPSAAAMAPTAAGVAPGTAAAAAAARRRRRQEAEAEEGEEMLPEDEQARREAERMAAAPPSKRARRTMMLAAGPPPVAVRTAAGDLVEVPRPALAPVPQPIAARQQPLQPPSLTAQQAAGIRVFGGGAGGDVAQQPALPLGVSRSGVPGSGFLGRVASAPSPLSAMLVTRPGAAAVVPATPAEDVAARIRQLALTQAQRGAALQRQTALQWARGL